MDLQNEGVEFDIGHGSFFRWLPAGDRLGIGPQPVRNRFENAIEILYVSFTYPIAILYGNGYFDCTGNGVELAPGRFSVLQEPAFRSRDPGFIMDPGHAP